MIFRKAIALFLLFIVFCFQSNAQTSLFVADSAQITINGALISANGDIETKGKIIGDTQSILFLNGNELQNIGDTLSDSIRLGSIYQTNRPGVCFNSNIHLINDTGYWFQGGPAFVNDRDIWFLGNSNWVDNNNSKRFFVNKGLGLIYKPNSGPGITYPVGFDSLPSAYAPIILENFGVPDNFGIRVQKGLDFHYQQPFGTPDSAPILSNAVNNTWIINEHIKGGTRLLYTPIWQASHELPGFFRPQSIVAWYSEIDQTWHWEDHQPAMGSNPYSARKIDTLFQNQTPISNYEYMPVSVGDPLSPLPLESIILKSKWIGNSPLLNIQYQFEENVGLLGIYRSQNGQSFELIDSFMPKQNNGSFSFLDRSYIKSNGNNWVYFQIRTLNRVEKIVSNTANLYYSANTLAYVFPNPTSNNLNLFFPTDKLVKGTIKIYELSGKLALHESAVFNENNNIVQVKTSGLAAGVYQLVFIYNNQSQVFRFTKKI